MFSIDDINSCIEEWFADASNRVEIAQTYAIILLAAEKQLDFMINNFKEDDK